MTHHLLLADDHALFRDAVEAVLAGELGADITVAGDLSTVIKLLAGADDFDLVLLDLYMPGIDGLDTIRDLMNDYPTQSIAILSGRAYSSDVAALRDIGLHGFFAKDMRLDQLANGINLVLSGQRFFPADHIDPPSPNDGSLPVRPHDDATKSDPVEGLTDRERDVAHHLLHGLSNRAIARKLDIASSTVKMHVRHICQKLSADNRTDAARILLQANFR